MKRLISIGVLAALLLIGMGWGENDALAQVNFQLTNISNNGFNNYYPDINDRGQAVWSGNGQIYYFDSRWDPATQSPVNISNSAATANYPKINNKGQVVWDAGGEIYYWNLAWDPATKSPVNISQQAFAEDYPQINDLGQVIWVGYGGPGGTREIYAYDLSWDPATHSPINISNNNFNDSISGGRDINDQGQVVWTGYGGPGGTSEIYYYDLSWAPGTTPQNISNTDWFDGQAQINNKGQVVWYWRPFSENDPGAAYYSEIYYYDLSWATGTAPRNISNQWGYDVLPELNDKGQVVWLLSVPYVQEVMYYDLSWDPGTAHQNISNTPSYNDVYPKINNRGQVVWTIHEKTPQEIYYYDLNWTPGTPAQYLASGVVWETPDKIKINDLGQVIWIGWGGPGGTQQIYVATPFTWATIDIKPGDYPNSINLGSNGNVPVAIFSTEDFDATQIDPASVTLSGASVSLKGKSDLYMTSVKELNGDGLPDLLVHVDTTAMQLSEGDIEAVLEGKTNNGLCIRGTDTVRIVP
jgi:hypothetical protein